MKRLTRGISGVLKNGSIRRLSPAERTRHVPFVVVVVVVVIAIVLLQWWRPMVKPGVPVEHTNHHKKGTCPNAVYVIIRYVNGRNKN